MPPRKKTPGVAAPQVLPLTLAQRIQHLRETRGMTTRRLAEVAMVSVELVEDIEAGLETFLSPAIRQKLARVLRVKPYQLQEVEKRPPLSVEAPEMEFLDRIELIQAILERPTRTYFCPSCGARLQVRIFERRDLNDLPITTLKVNCSNCLFHLEHG